MNNIHTLLYTLNNLLGSQLVAPIQWRYEHARAQGHILLPPPSSGRVSGPYQLGQVIWQNSCKGTFGLCDEEIIQHTAIYGRSGAGKTNYAFLLLYEMMRHNKPFIVFDGKQTYRSLCQDNQAHLFTPGHQTAPF